MTNTNYNVTLPCQEPISPYTMNTAEGQGGSKTIAQESPQQEDTCTLSLATGNGMAEPRVAYQKGTCSTAGTGQVEAPQEPESFISRFAHSTFGRCITAAVAVGGLCAALSGCAALPNGYGGIDIVPIMPPVYGPVYGPVIPPPFYGPRPPVFHPIPHPCFHGGGFHGGGFHHGFHR